ncbi:MAG: hypothetical protein HC897_19505 [Thermoanaerobaculia bacterium]|nr:hypothetical protein [Thermoanaerobaculia bacterium]
MPRSRAGARRPARRGRLAGATGAPSLHVGGGLRRHRPRRADLVRRRQDRWRRDPQRRRRDRRADHPRRPAGSRLAGDKGINLPDTRTSLPGLTAKDFDDLSFAVEAADVVGLSFVRRTDDVLALQEHVQRLGAPNLGMVLKIENRQAFENLPRLLMASLRSPPVGVMVARGDLAVEVGFERLAEVQEEILWLCEAAHVPVIWATQVLESLAKHGAPSRAEVTDASKAGRAECVMLNKGPHAVGAVRFLSDVLARMQAHQSKNRGLLRKLEVSRVS